MHDLLWPQRDTAAVEAQRLSEQEKRLDCSRILAAYPQHRLHDLLGAQKNVAAEAQHHPCSAQRLGQLLRLLWIRCGTPAVKASATFNFVLVVIRQHHPCSSDAQTSSFTFVVVAASGSSLGTETGSICMQHCQWQDARQQREQHARVFLLPVSHSIYARDRALTHLPCKKLSVCVTHESMHSCSSSEYAIFGWSWLRLSSFCRSCTTLTCCAAQKQQLQSDCWFKNALLKNAGSPSFCRSCTSLPCCVAQQQLPITIFHQSGARYYQACRCREPCCMQALQLVRAVLTAHDVKFYISKDHRCTTATLVLLCEPRDSRPRVSRGFSNHLQRQTCKAHLQERCGLRDAARRISAPRLKIHRVI